MRYLSCCLATGLLLQAASSIATTIYINNGDGAGEGFNDATPVAPVIGNSGTTLGQQRLNVFYAAAKYWDSFLSNTVPIYVQATMDPLECDAWSAILGSAGPTSVFVNFTNAPQANTFYPVALANSIAKRDLNGTTPEIAAQFNSSVDNNNNCLANHNWCYQIGGTCPANSTSLYDTVLHELGHGLGFLTFVDSDGQKFYGFNDHFMRFLQDNTTGKLWPNMTDGERYASARNNALVWTGENVNTSSNFLTAGKLAGRVKLFAPNPYQDGSSVSHWDTSLSPNELMEPYSTPTSLATLTKKAFKDMGWSVSPLLYGPSPADGATVSSYNATSRVLQINITNVTNCTIHYGTDVTTSMSVNGTINNGVCTATIPYDAHLTNDGTNYWYIEAGNTEGTVRYPESSGVLSFTTSSAEPESMPMPWLQLLL